MTERVLHLSDGRSLRTYDSAPDATRDAVTIVLHHGSPQTGAPLPPLLTAAAARGIRLVSYGRPSYGGSSPLPGRDVASAARDVAGMLDALGVARFATMGASGGGPHALACAALLPGRVTGVVCLASIAPFTTAFDWFAGMASPGGLRAAVAGREARALYAVSDEFDPANFIAVDYVALAGDWASLGSDSVRAGEDGPDGLIDDDVAFALPWGFELSAVTAPVLVVQGGQDRVVPPADGDWLARNLRRSELWYRPDDGHVSILRECPAAMDWLVAQQATGRPTD